MVQEFPAVSLDLTFYCFNFLFITILIGRAQVLQISILLEVLLIIIMVLTFGPVVSQPVHEVNLNSKS